MTTYRFATVFEKDENGYFVYCPQLPGCYSQGNTYEQAMENIQDAIQLIVQELQGSAEAIPQGGELSTAIVEVEV